MKNIFLLVSLILITGAVKISRAQSTQQIRVHTKEPSEGLYVVSDLENRNYGYCRRNDKGQYVTVIENKYDDALSFSEGTGRVKLNGKWGLIDRSGRSIIHCQYELIGPFSDPYLNLAKVKKNDKWGFIDRSGAEVVPPKYDGIAIFTFMDYLEPFEDCGLITVKLNKKYGVIDHRGREVLAVQYDDFNSGIDGLIPAKKDGKWGLINCDRERVIPFQYDHLSLLDPLSESNTLLIAHLSDKRGVITTSDKIIVPLAYEEVEFSEGVILVQKGNKWGIYSTKGQALVEPKFDDQPYFNNGIAKVKIAGKEALVDTKGKIFNAGD